MSKQKYPQSQSVSTTSTGERLRGKVNGYSNFHLHAKQNAKRLEAENRNAKYAALTLKEKFATLIPGGSKRQVARLNKLMELEPVPVVPESKPVKKKTVKK